MHEGIDPNAVHYPPFFPKHLPRKFPSWRLAHTDDGLIFDLTGMTAEQFFNAEDAKVQRALKTRILVVPPFDDRKRVPESLSRSNSRGFGLPATAMDQSKAQVS